MKCAGLVAVVALIGACSTTDALFAPRDAAAEPLDVDGGPIGQNSSTGSNGRYVAMVAPVAAESFVGPATLRMIAAAYDPLVFTNTPREGLGGNAAQVQFFVDDARVLTIDGGTAEYFVFKGFAGPVTAGPHAVRARAIYTDPVEVLDSLPVLVTVADPPAYAGTVDLGADVVLSGNEAYALVGTASGRIRLNGHGHRIASAVGASGALTLQFVDVFDLGDAVDGASPGIDVATSGAVTIEDSSFDGSNAIVLSPEGSAPVSIRRNTFRSNMRMPLGQRPDAYSQPASYPVVRLGGGSTGVKTFAGNNVGAGWLELDSVQGWVIGGDTDADSNVLIGPRVGISIQSSNDVQVRRNFSHHIYFGGWSEANNLELQGSTSILIEHNVVFGGSWQVRGAAGEFRHNLVLGAGDQWLWPSPGAAVHHNIFVGGENNVAGIFVLNGTPPAAANLPAIAVYNNTIDGLGAGTMATAVLMASSAGPVTLSSNAFLRVPSVGVVTIEGGALSADYNGYFDSSASSYSDGRVPAHDVSGADPQVASQPERVFDLDEAAVWTRSTTTADVLRQYRSRYAPVSGSPLLGAGDPALAAGNWIGAVGDGTSLDRFGVP